MSKTGRTCLRPIRYRVVVLTVSKTGRTWAQSETTRYWLVVLTVSKNILGHGQYHHAVAGGWPISFEPCEKHQVLVRFL